MELYVTEKINHGILLNHFSPDVSYMITHCAYISVDVSLLTYTGSAHMNEVGDVDSIPCSASTLTPVVRLEANLKRHLKARKA